MNALGTLMAALTFIFFDNNDVRGLKWALEVWEP